ncbi:hypothetical protein [Pedosphaera parvula]|uniref:STAS/SEC14 domain-containing protein n=1 Tax=Pedosphaera parvula (strain Ellin514) TaxID=320771 RepID=B9XS33_PEDPL|nr:hypothetical protein [Pedosphaera parvula]EEF57365.1 hypothetical protein Cflav_PD0586 [Pedosphaera parvula Ellin514]
MSKPEHFEILEDHAVFRPTDYSSLHHVVEQVAAVIAYAREKKIRKLMVVLIGPHGFPSPTIVERYYLVRKWAETARGHVHVAVVVKPKFIDADGFSVTVATNNGFSGNVFPAEPEALAWLQSLA